MPEEFPINLLEALLKHYFPNKVKRYFIPKDFEMERVIKIKSYISDTHLHKVKELHWKIFQHFASNLVSP